MEPAKPVFGVLIEIPNTEVTLLENGKTTVVDKGTLQLIQSKETGFMMVNVNTFRYTISTEIPIHVTYDKGYPVYTLPNLEGSYIIAVMGPVEEDLIEALELYFQSACDFKKGEGRRMQPIQQEPQQGGDLNTPDGVVAEQTKTQRVGAFITGGGDMVKEGIIKVATFVAGGITGVGGYITEKVDHAGEVKVNETLKNGVSAAKTTTNGALTYCKGAVQGLIQSGEGVTKKMGESWDNNETCQKLDADEKFQAVKVVGKSTVHVVSSLYGGIVEAGQIIRTSIGTATANLVEKRYGKEAGDTTRESFDAVGNVVEVTRVIQTEVASHIKKETDPNLQRPENVNVAQA